ncbi:hypothetical protein LTR78_002122 [Recurvomyces mirabilis]|uniref:Rab-GAP TBC domain-containing protein n=1 Tax=Recurvomyces mirabilis TaxID=574656 RepID=A0AAE0WUF4_9PEZI|nr:hypothetical protein LTR78_002122 [Recurvomyces mirabilis]KAK5160579.1 hypothetical protein LTS14_001591 [Recurvomyces mirabilis]
MGDLSRQQSHQHLLASDDTNSLTSFPDPEAEQKGEQDGEHGAKASLHDLLAGIGPSIFDDPAREAPTDPQTLSKVPSPVLQTIIDHNGAVALVRRLSRLLAERDAHITALTRLAEEYKIPKARVEDTASRIKQAEQRRHALQQAAEEELAMPAKTDSIRSVPTPSAEVPTAGQKLARLFGGGTVRRRSPASPRSTSIVPTADRKRTESDARSVQSADSGWAASLFGGSTLKRQDTNTTREPVELTTQHDRDDLPPTLQEARQDPQEAAWNKFLLSITKARSKSGHAAQTNGGGLVGPLVGQQKMKALTLLVVAGVPLHMRQYLWLELSNTESIVDPGEYDSYRSNADVLDQSEIDAIVNDVPRTLTQSRNFYTNKGFQRLKEVLLAFVAKYDDLGYTQGLNSIAGYLLLAMPQSEDAFWLLCNMVEQYFPKDYFARDAALSGPLADVIVLRSYIKELMPQLDKHLEDIGIDSQRTVPMRWFFTAFSNVLGEDALMRVWDIWLCLPGQKTFLFNVALALLMQNLNGLLACETEGDFWMYMDDKESFKVDGDIEWVNRLIKSAVDLRKELMKVEERRAWETKLLRKKAGSCEALYSPDDPTDMPKSVKT